MLPHHLDAPANQLCNLGVWFRAEQFDFFFCPCFGKNDRDTRFLPFAMGSVDCSGDSPG